MIAIVDYDAGNIRSVVNALERLGVKDYVVTSDAEVIRSADKVLMPGVGDASYAMANLKARGLEGVIPELRQPVLGICVGLQLLCSSSEEGNIRCLGIFEENVVRFRSDDPAVKLALSSVKFTMPSRISFSSLMSLPVSSSACERSSIDTSGW